MKGQKMSITVSRYAYENGVKSASINERLNQDHTRCLDIGFYSTEDLQALQDELNNIFPENIKLDKKFKEPEEEGLYLTSTGLLLFKDTEHTTRETHIPAQRIVIGWEKTTITRPIGSR